MQLLINEHNITFSPALATLLGVNKAIFLQTIHYWQYKKSLNPEKFKDHFYDGDYWIHMTIENWVDQLPFFSKFNSKNKHVTMQRLVDSLREDGLIECVSFDARDGDQTLWYRIIHSELDNLLKKHENEIAEITKKRLSRKETFKDKMKNKLYPDSTTCEVLEQIVENKNKKMKSIIHNIPYRSSYGSSKEEDPANAGIALDDEIPKKKKEKKIKSAQSEEIDIWTDELRAIYPKDRLPNSKKMIKEKLRSLKDENEKPVKLDQDVIDKIKKSILLYERNHWQSVPEEERKFIPLLNNFIGKGYWIPDLELIERKTKQLGAKYVSSRKKNFDSAMNSFMIKLEKVQEQVRLEVQEERKQLGESNDK